MEKISYVFQLPLGEQVAEIERLRQIDEQSVEDVKAALADGRLTATQLDSDTVDGIITRLAQAYDVYPLNLTYTQKALDTVVQENRHRTRHN